MGNQLVEIADRLAGVRTTQSAAARGLVARTPAKQGARTPPVRRGRAVQPRPKSDRAESVADDELDDAGDGDDDAARGVNIGKIVAYLRTCTEGARTKSIADATGIQPNNVSSCCGKHPKLVTKIGYGMWKLGPGA